MKRMGCGGGRAWLGALALVGPLSIGACGGDDGDKTDTADGQTVDTIAPDADAADDADDIEDTDDTDDVAVDSASDTADSAETDSAVDSAETDTVTPVTEGPCDPLDPSHCLFPFPSNLYVEADATRTTGFTLDFGDALPMNVDGKPMESAPYRRLDGYGVGTPLMVSFPDLDFTGLANEHDTDPSLAEDAPIVWLAVAADGTAKRVPYFVDKDVRETDPNKRVVIVRPAAILEEATRYVVAFRGMHDTAGHVYAPSPAFAALRDGTAADDAALAPRVATFDKVFADLEAAGITRGSLQLAWDFVTASCDALHGPLQHMIADALATTGPQGPTLDDINVETITDDANWALEIRGTIEVPLYMKEAPMFRSDGTVWVFNNGPDGLPVQNGTARAPFWIRIPPSALPVGDQPAPPHGLVLYGHGQNGSGTEVRSGRLGEIAGTYHYIYFSTDMWGMSEGDFGGIVDMLTDLSGFPRLADRLQQGLLNHVLLARAMRERFAALPEVAGRGIVVDPTRLFYSGISQGGIYGASVVAVSPDIQRGHLGVPGNNYGYLLTRSRNFEPFFFGVSAGYPERWQQLVLVAAIEQLWEQSDSVSYLRHVHASPFPGQGPNEVLLAPAKGDPQVAVSSNESVARSGLGIPVMLPYDTERNAPSGAETATYPRTGSGIVLWDFGNPWPAPSEVLPPTSEVEDPHSKPRRDAAHNRQLSHFLETGEIIDVCSDDGVPGCTPN